ncbi:MAG: hypothetical protein QNJ30_24375 [Kiloniellales bacterium]|nr:hypothetical protein [Kiloniellales bacterium]
MKAARLSSDHVVRKGASARRQAAAPKVVRLEDSELWARKVAALRQAETSRRKAPDREAAAARADARPDGDVRLSLRVDGAAHRRLKLIAACRQQSLQEILASAVETYLRDAGPETLSELTALLSGDHGEES